MVKSSVHIPLRTCIGCQQKKDKYSLTRIVQNKDKICEIDFSQTQDGRGFYICPDRTCLQIGIQKLRHYRKRIYLSSTQQSVLRNKVEEIIQKAKIYSLVGLARKAGRVAIGHAAVEAVIKKKQTKLVILATDASENTRDRFNFFTRQNNIQCGIYGFKAEWGNVFGRETAAVFAILHHGFARAIGAELQKSSDNN